MHPIDLCGRDLLGIEDLVQIVYFVRDRCPFGFDARNGDTLFVQDGDRFPR